MLTRRAAPLVLENHGAAPILRTVLSLLDQIGADQRLLVVFASENEVAVCRRGILAAGFSNAEVVPFSSVGSLDMRSFKRIVYVRDPGPLPPWHWAAVESLTVEFSLPSKTG